MRYVVLYLVAIVAANLLVARYGAWITPITAFAFIGFDITSRDRLHEAWHGKHLWMKMLALICVGSALSYALNQGAWRIAVASTVAFLVSGLLDAVIYHVLFKHSKWVKINGSNVFSAAADSILFPTIAFGVFMPWVVLGQFVAKVGGGLLWAWVLTRRAVA